MRSVFRRMLAQAAEAIGQAAAMAGARPNAPIGSGGLQMLRILISLPLSARD